MQRSTVCRPLVISLEPSSNKIQDSNPFVLALIDGDGAIVSWCPPRNKSLRSEAEKH